MVKEGLLLVLPLEAIMAKVMVMVMKSHTVTVMWVMNTVRPILKVAEQQI